MISLPTPYTPPPRRRVWPWVVGGIALVGGVSAVVLWSRSAKAEQQKLPAPVPGPTPGPNDSTIEKKVEGGIPWYYKLDESAAGFTPVLLSPRGATSSLPPKPSAAEAKADAIAQIAQVGGFPVEGWPDQPAPEPVLLEPGGTYHVYLGERYRLPLPVAAKSAAQTLTDGSQPWLSDLFFGFNAQHPGETSMYVHAAPTTGKQDVDVTFFDEDGRDIGRYHFVVELMPWYK